MRPDVRREGPSYAVVSDRDLLLSFEGIGDNCEFGVVQRCCGVEPLGLFRFSGSQLINMIDCIRTKTERLFAHDDLDLYPEPTVDEYMYRCKAYNDFPYHTEISLSNIDIDDVKRRVWQKITFLKRRFVEDLIDGDKIFLRKGLAPLEEILSLHDALKSAGPNRLLWVLEADADHAAGSVDLIRPGLAAGYVEYFKDFTKDQPVDLEHWLEILKQAYVALPKGDAPVAVTFEGNTLIARSREWFAHPRAAVVPIQPRTNGAMTDQAVTVVQLRTDARPDDMWAICKIDHGLDPRSAVVFSAWILVPQGYRGGRISVWMPNMEVNYGNLADLTIRDRWQRLWAAGRTPKDYLEIRPYLMASGCQGDVLLLSDWTFETGICPSSERHLTVGKRPRERFLRPTLYRFASRWTRSRGGRIAAGSRFWSSCVPVIDRSIAEGAFAYAEDLLAPCLDRFPDDPTLLKQSAVSAHNRGLHIEAVNRWDKALTASPDDPMCHAGLACNLREAGDIDRAAAVVSTALQRFDDDLVLATEAARVFQVRGQHDLALAQWNKVMRFCDPHPDWVCARARVLMNLGRIDDAKTALSEAMSTFADNPAFRRLRIDLDNLSTARASVG